MSAFLNNLPVMGPVEDNSILNSEQMSSLMFWFFYSFHSKYLPSQQFRQLSLKAQVSDRKWKVLFATIP